MSIVRFPPSRLPMAVVHRAPPTPSFGGKSLHEQNFCMTKNLLVHRQFIHLSSLWSCIQCDCQLSQNPRLPAPDAKVPVAVVPPHPPPNISQALHRPGLSPQTCIGLTVTMMVMMGARMTISRKLDVIEMLPGVSRKSFQMLQNGSTNKTPCISLGYFQPSTHLFCSF